MAACHKRPHAALQGFHQIESRHGLATWPKLSQWPLILPLPERRHACFGETFPSIIKYTRHCSKLDQLPTPHPNPDTCRVVAVRWFSTCSSDRRSCTLTHIYCANRFLYKRPAVHVSALLLFACPLTQRQGCTVSHCCRFPLT